MQDQEYEDEQIQKLSEHEEGPLITGHPLSKRQEKLDKLEPAEIGKIKEIRVTVTQNDKGECTVIEHDVERGFSRPAAKFPAERRKVTLPDGDVMEKDLAQIRAMLFAQLYETLVNNGTVDLG